MEALSKVILLVYIGEKTATNISVLTEQYPKVREALDFCWKWIEKREVNEEKIYEFLDDEDEDDLVGYMLFANDEIEKKELAVILGVVSYISSYILSTNKLPIPQFLLESDEKYYDLIINDVVALNISDCDREYMNRIAEYCDSKIALNGLSFSKSEIMSIK